MKTTHTHKSVSCRQIKQDLSLLAGRDLTDRERIETVRRHIAVCPNCRAKYRSLRDGLKVLTSSSSAGTDGSASDSGTWVSSSRSLWPELAERLPVRPSSRANGSTGWSSGRNWPPMVAMVAACGVMAVVLFAPGGPGNHPSGTASVEPVNMASDSVPHQLNEKDVVPAKTPGVFQLNLPGTQDERRTGSRQVHSSAPKH